MVVHFFKLEASGSENARKGAKLGFQGEWLFAQD